jgi:hypothetical protein
MMVLMSKFVECWPSMWLLYVHVADEKIDFGSNLFLDSIQAEIKYTVFPIFSYFEITSAAGFFLIYCKNQNSDIVEPYSIDSILVILLHNFKS